MATILVDSFVLALGMIAVAYLLFLFVNVVFLGKAN